jgi:predicted nucleic acid-binding protein
MRLVIADTGPINYLVLIGHIELLPALFARIAVPSAVYRELVSSRAPDEVRRWITGHPTWLEVHEPQVESNLPRLDVGEKAAIELARELKADLILIDDRRGVSVARSMGLRVTGTLGVLDLAAERCLIDFPGAVKRLEKTTFHRPTAVSEALLEKHKRSDG